MKARILHLWLISLVLALASVSSVSAGVRDGGGGDIAKSPFQSFAWFYGSAHSVQVCMEVAPDFGLSKEKILPQLTQALETWKTYIKQKQLDKKYDQFNGRFQFSTAMTFLKSCTGKEDLKFYFGGQNPEIDSAKKLFNDPVGMAILTDFNSAENWGKGFVWIAPEKGLNEDYPNWQFKDNVLTILLHEIGHVYGNNHVPGTIMTEQIMSLLAQEISSTLKTRIDLFRELYTCDECSMKRVSSIVTQGGDSEKDTASLLSRILSHGFSGITQAILKKPEGAAATLTLTIRDELLKTEDSFEIHVTGKRKIDGPFVFSNRWLGWSSSSGKIQYGYLTTKENKRIDLVIESNLVDYTQSMPEMSTLMKISGFVDGQFSDLSTFQIQHELNQ